MNEYQAESQAERDAEERHTMELEARKFNLMDRVRAPEGYLGNVTGYGEGHLNIRVTFRSRSAWYNDAELTGV